MLHHSEGNDLADQLLCKTHLAPVKLVNTWGIYGDDVIYMGDDEECPRFRIRPEMGGIMINMDKPSQIAGLPLGLPHQNTLQIHCTGPASVGHRVHPI